MNFRTATYQEYEACCTHVRDEIYTRFVVGKPEGKRPLGQPRHRWEYSIRMDLREVELDSSGSG
jgi:hypothetical protein